MLFIVFANVRAQNKPANCKIALIGRYKNNLNELRWMPDNKSILQLGFTNSYTIERSDSGKNNFIKLGEIKPYTMVQWDSLISNEIIEETKTNLEIARDFLFDESEKEKNAINLEGGIAALQKQKSKEDFVYTVFVLTAMSNSKVAMALGLGYLDNSINPDKKYTYKIILNASSNIYHIEKGTVNIHSIEDKNKYKNQVFVYPGDRKLSFGWASQKELSGFFVERAAPGESTFKPLNSVPFYASAGIGYKGLTNGAYEDDSLINYKTYSYRFYGKNSFGDKILFSEVIGMPRDLTPPNDPILAQPKHTKPREVKLSWEIYGDLSDLRGFIVALSNTEGGKYTVLNKTLLSKTARTFTDTSFKANGNNYYKVYAIDTAGNMSVSYSAYVALIDSTPPAKPEILKALIDSNGVVTLHIKKGKEEDLKGYQIFTSNSKEHEFSVIEESYKEDAEDTTPIKLIIIDTVSLNSLTPKIFYRIKALDFNFNQSVFSEIKEVKRPDTIPPVTPVFRDVKVYSNQVKLVFALSSSQDVVSHILYRKTDLKKDWEIYASIDSISQTFTDTSVKQGVMYYYTLRAQDDSKLYSAYAQAVQGKPYDNGVRPPIENLKGEKVKEGIKITWTYPILQSNGVKYEIYKLDANGKLKLLDVINDHYYIDTKIEVNNTYQIRVVTNDGGHSKLSSKLVVTNK